MAHPTLPATLICEVLKPAEILIQIKLLHFLQYVATDPKTASDRSMGLDRQIFSRRKLN